MNAFVQVMADSVRKKQRSLCQHVHMYLVPINISCCSLKRSTFRARLGGGGGRGAAAESHNPLTRDERSSGIVGVIVVATPFIYRRDELRSIVSKTGANQSLYCTRKICMRR